MKPEEILTKLIKLRRFELDHDICMFTLSTHNDGDWIRWNDLQKIVQEIEEAIKLEDFYNNNIANL